MAKDNPNCPEENGPDLDYSASSLNEIFIKRRMSMIQLETSEPN